MTDGADGGYYAIKGFLYQFDCALIEMLRNSTAYVAFENRQDVDYEDYVLQIKHRETQKFEPAKIRKAVAQLLSVFSAAPSLKLILYCYFNDQAVHDWRPSTTELDQILGADAEDSPGMRQRFQKCFIVRFSEDYKTQFRTLLSLIKSDFSIKTDEEAILYHALFRSHLLESSILPRDQRRCSRQELAALRADSEQIVFYSGYARHLGQTKYEAMLRGKFFTCTAPNIENYERLFILEPESSATIEAALECVTRLARKYFRPGKSPQPYVCFRGVPATFINEVKRALLDQGVAFCDGTFFDGDRFRANALASKCSSDAKTQVKFVPESALSEITKLVRFREIFQMYTSSSCKISVSCRHVCVAVDELDQVKRIIK